MEKLLRQWNVGSVSTIELLPSFTGKVSRVRTADGRRFIMKEKSSPAAAEHEGTLLNGLAKSGAPVAPPLRTLTGAFFARDGEAVFCLSPELSGKAFSDHYAPGAAERAEMFGKAISLLHSSLLKCDQLAGFPGYHLLDHVNEWAIPIIRQHPGEASVGSLEAAWKTVEAGMAPVYSLLPVQLIHRDAHPGNMLFEAGRLTGWIDFDMVMRGSRLFDLAYCGTSLLMAAYPDEAKMQFWPKLVSSLLKGYQQANPLTSPEKQSLPGAMIAIELIFIALGLDIHAENVSKPNESLVYWLMENRGSIPS